MSRNISMFLGLHGRLGYALSTETNYRLVMGCDWLARPTSDWDLRIGNTVAEAKWSRLLDPAVYSGAVGVVMVDPEQYSLLSNQPFDDWRVIQTNWGPILLQDFGRNSGLSAQQPLRSARLEGDTWAGWFLPDAADSPHTDELRKATGEFLTLAWGMARNEPLDTSDALLELANEAARSCAERQNEDIRAWAERLAQDVGSAID